MSNARKYVDGARILALRAPSRSDVVGAPNWWQVLYNPAGVAYDYYNTGQARGFGGGATQNPYWAAQRTAVNPFTAAMPARTQTAAALQAQLRQQQMAYIANLQSQLASMSAATPSAVPGVTSPSSPDMTASTPDASSDPDLTSVSPDSSVVGAALGDQALVIRVKNVGDIIKQKGGALGNAAFSLAPQTIANTVYSEMQKQLVQKMKEQGVDVDITVTGNPPTGLPPKAEFLRGAMVGVGAVGVGWAAWHYLLRGLIKRRK